MDKNALKEVVLSSIADLFLGIAGTYLFIGYNALEEAKYTDLLYSLALAILSFSTAVYLRYVKLAQSH